MSQPNDWFQGISILDTVSRPRLINWELMIKFPDFKLDFDRFSHEVKIFETQNSILRPWNEGQWWWCFDWRLGKSNGSREYSRGHYRRLGRIGQFKKTCSTLLVHSMVHPMPWYYQTPLYSGQKLFSKLIVITYHWRELWSFHRNWIFSNVQWFLEMKHIGRKCTLSGQPLTGQKLATC